MTAKEFVAELGQLLLRHMDDKIWALKTFSEVGRLSQTTGEVMFTASGEMVLRTSNNGLVVVLSTGETLHVTVVRTL